jgi:hypothetical protein
MPKKSKNGVRAKNAEKAETVFVVGRQNFGRPPPSAGDGS